MPDWNHNFRIETWTECAFGIIFILLRLSFRSTRLGGPKNWQTDDWVALQTLFWYILLVFSLNKVVFGGGSNFMTPDQIATLTPKIKAERVEGSKWVLVSEQAMIITVWSCKACMLIIYHRLTNGLSQARLINAVTAWTVAGFIGTQIALFTACRPFSNYWSVPAASTQCWSYWNYEYVEGAFNVSADVAMLVVAIPLVAKVRLPWAQKAPVLGIFGMGVFVITAAVLTKVYCFVPSLLSYEYLAWYCREASVSVYVTMLPAAWSGLRELFPVLKHWGYRTNTGDRSAPFMSDDLRKDGSNAVNMQSMSRSGRRRSLNVLKSNSSEERIMGPMVISKDTTFVVEEGSVDSMDASDSRASTYRGFSSGPGGVGYTNKAYVSTHR